MHRPVPDEIGAGQESVWSYPRPPRLEPVSERLVVRVGPLVIADTTGGYRVLETSHPPGYYLPPGDCDFDRLEKAAGSSFCEWKGTAAYWDVVLDGQVLARAAWSYPHPTGPFEAIRDHLAFYPTVLECSVDGERATPQPGGFYGGWITSNVVGPFKGSPGTSGW